MCAIVGIIARGHPRERLETLARKMARTMYHRGPDDHGVWVDEDTGIALGHQRLAIQDLSPAGHQPMVSDSGRYVLVFNGEIYNHWQLRNELEKAGQAPAWRGRSDTETLLAAIEAWGVDQALKRVVGMFAFGLWDSKERVLLLARDRMGEKPLYYGWTREWFFFTSELKALRMLPDGPPEISRSAVVQLLRYGYIPSPSCIYEGIHKLPPGTYLALPWPPSPQPTYTTYWDLRKVIGSSVHLPKITDEHQALEMLEGQLKETIKGQLIADVPVGAFLSGGIDSSVVVALMQSLCSEPVKTFTIGFHNPDYNEAPFAKAVASYLGTEHHELYLSPREAMDVIPSLPSIYDEPFADSSQIPTCLVAAMASQHVKVSLSGDGGDELFCGYPRYRLLEQIWKVLRLVPSTFRRALAWMISRLPLPLMLGLARSMLTRAQVSPQRLKRPGITPQEVRNLIGAPGPRELYLWLVEIWHWPQEVVIGGESYQGPEAPWDGWPEALTPMELAMAIDQLTYLPEDLLVKVDRAAMAVSLETRLPLLDHRIVELAWSLGLSLKYRQGRTKVLLKKLLSRYVPPSLFERPKRGFGVPVAEWLRGELKPWALALLDPVRLRNEGFFDPVKIHQTWTRHQEGKNLSHRLWPVLMFQAWMEANRQGH